jgi:hypothetical protein
MKKLLAVIALLVSLNANATTLEDVKASMLNAGFMTDYDSMKMPNVIMAWKRGMSRYQCDLFTNTMINGFSNPKFTKENTPDSRIEVVVTNPGILFGCAGNTSMVWLVKN